MASTHADVVKQVQANPQYVALFKQAWGTDQITIDLVVKSIASFERTVLSGNSPFDRFYYAHDKKALSAAAQRGLQIFTDPKKGNCAVCHTIGKEYALFTDNKFHNLGIGIDANGDFPTAGVLKRPRTIQITRLSRLPLFATSRIALLTCTTDHFRR